MLEIGSSLVIDDCSVFKQSYYELKTVSNYCSIYRKAILVEGGKHNGIKPGIIVMPLIIYINRVIYKKPKELWLLLVNCNRLIIDRYVRLQLQPISICHIVV